MGESTAPGAYALTVMPCLPNSRAMNFTRQLMSTVEKLFR